VWLEVFENTQDPLRRSVSKVSERLQSVQWEQRNLESLVLALDSVLKGLSLPESSERLLKLATPSPDNVLDLVDAGELPERDRSRKGPERDQM
jgi:hypothetical protein